MVTLAIVVLFVLVASIRLLYNHVRLNTIPGPVLAGLSSFWLHAQPSSQLPNSLLQLHEKYGTIVRIGPDLVSVSNPATIVPIYTRRSRNRVSLHVIVSRNDTNLCLAKLRYPIPSDLSSSSDRNRLRQTVQRTAV